VGDESVATPEGMRKPEVTVKTKALGLDSQKGKEETENRQELKKECRGGETLALFGRTP